jgi:hypothetical protein
MRLARSTARPPRRPAAILILALLLPAAAPAQAPNLSGTWVLQVDKSNFGDGPAPATRTDVIDHQEPKLLIKRTVGSAAGVFTSDLVYGIDGKPYKNTVGPNETTSTLRWDGETLEMVSEVQNAQGAATLTDRFTLSADKNTLTMARIINAGGAQIAQTFVFARKQ